MKNIKVPIELVDNILRYCEDNAIWDKLGNYGDFYYKLKTLKNKYKTMGQRTQLLVVRENNKGERKVKFYHHQWGYGRIMYLALMDCFMNDYNKETFKNCYNFLENKNFTTNEKIYDITKDIPEDVLDNVDLSDIRTVKDVFDYGDNNNGGIVISIKENEKTYNMSSFKIGFLLGDEDSYTYDEDDNEIEIEKPFSRWLTPQEYGKMNGACDLSDEEFIKVFTGFCEYFGIEYLGQPETKEEN